MLVHQMTNKVADADFYFLVAVNFAYIRNLCSYLACEVRCVDAYM